MCVCMCVCMICIYFKIAKNLFYMPWNLEEPKLCNKKQKVCQ